MAILYVDSGGSGTAPYDTWAKASTTLKVALDAAAAGDTIYIYSGHTETPNVNTSYAGAGTSVSPIVIVATSDNTNNPPNAGTYQNMVDGTGTINNAGGGYDITFGGHNIWHGLKFQIGDDLFSSATSSNTYHDCLIAVADNISITGVNTQDTSYQFYDTTIEFTGSGGNFIIDCHIVWHGGIFRLNGGSVATYVFQAGSFRPNIWSIRDVDFQDIDSGDILFRKANDSMCDVTFARCKLPSAFDFPADLFDSSGIMENTSVKFHSVSDASGIEYFQENYFEGQINQDTSIYLNATYDGTNGYSAKMVSNANAIEVSRPLRFKLADLYVDATGSTLTVELVLDSATSLNDDDFWVDVEYPDSTTTQLGNIITSKADVLATPVALTTSTVTWTGTSGFTNEQKRKVAIDFTGVADEAVGVYTVWANLAIPSTTVYVDPKITVT